MTFVPLFCESYYSPWGVSSCGELVRRARAMGYGVLGLSDEATCAGFQEFDEACREQGVRPVFGCRLRLPGLVRTGDVHPLDLLIETEQGYRNLARLLTQVHGPAGADPAQTRLSLRGRLGGLRVVLPPDGELTTLLRRRDRAAAERFLETAQETLGPGALFGLSPLPEDREVNDLLVRLALFLGTKTVAAPRVRVLEPGDLPAYVFLTQPDQAPGRAWQPPAALETWPLLRPAEATARHYSGLPEAVGETGEASHRCAWRPATSRRLIPAPDLERGFDAESFLFDLAIRGARERYGEITEEIKQRIHREFEEVKSQGLAPLLLLSRQIVQIVEEEAIARGFGRGSVVASVLAYCLGLTQIDPLPYRLAPKPLRGEGETLPPLRLEIAADAMPRLIARLERTFGQGHLARIGRRQALRREQLLERLAAWAGMTAEERALAMRLRPPRLRPAGGADHLRAQAEQRRPRRWRDPAFAAEIATRLAPRPRGPLPAPGRWAICADPLDHVTPLIAPAGPARGEPGAADAARLTDLEEAALDRLGVARLEVIPQPSLHLVTLARAAAQAGDGGSREVAPEGTGRLVSIPPDDRPTYDLLARGETTGIGPLDGVTIKCLLRKERPGSILSLLKAKTLAGRGRPAGAADELIDALPDVLIAYQCAYLKVHAPAAFYAAALSTAAEGGGPVAILARAARREGIELLPPDINLSSAANTLQGGRIRLGLRMVRLCGEKSAEEIQAVRRGGIFHSLEDFSERVSARAVNGRLMQHLIAAGAFDGFGQPRARLADRAARRERRPAAPSMTDDDPFRAQATLFDLEAIESPPESPPAPEDGPLAPASEELEREPIWDEATRRARQIEALGFDLEGDPLAPFEATLLWLAPLRPEQLGPRHEGRTLRLAGLVQDVDREGPLIEAEGGMLIEIEGVAVWAPPSVAAHCTRAAQRGRPVLVIGRWEVAGGFARLTAQGMWPLEDIEEQARRVAAVRLNLAGENKRTLKHLIGLSRQFRGAARLEPRDYPAPRGWTYRLLAAQRVFFCSPFYQGLCKILPADRISLFDPDGRPLAISASQPSVSSGR